MLDESRLLCVPCPTRMQANYHLSSHSKPTRREYSNFINKDNLKADFAETYDVTKVKDVYDVVEHRHHSPEANDVRLGSKVTVEFMIAIWGKK